MPNLILCLDANLPFAMVLNFSRAVRYNYYRYARILMCADSTALKCII